MYHLSRAAKEPSPIPARVRRRTNPTRRTIDDGLQVLEIGDGIGSDGGYENDSWD
jgi:hypothetical protein